MTRSPGRGTARRTSHRALPEPRRTVPYAELHAHSSFSHLDGASLPEEMVEAAVAAGLSALALTDHDGMYGVVRFAEAAKTFGLPTIYGAELSLDIPVPDDQRRALDRRPGRVRPTRPGGTCSCWPATRPVTPACAGPSASPSAAAAPRAARSTTSTS